jgi:lipopolysaccharide export system protein LptA
VKRQFPLWLAIATSLLAPAMAAAQGPAPAPSLLPGQNRDQPVQIEAASLDVHDKSKTATFSGNVQVVQGDTTMKCQSLVVFYGHEVGIAQNATKQASAIIPDQKGAQDIRRIEAHGGVTVITKDQNASGDTAIYDLQSKTITLNGNVIVSQGQNVIHGQRVVVDTVTGNARVESSEGGGAVPGRVRALILPNQKGQNGGSGNMMTIGPGRPN